MNNKLRNTLALMAMAATTAAMAGPVLDRIKQAGTIKLGYPQSHSLVASSGAAGPEGFAIDLCKAIADGVKAELGASGLKSEFVAVSTDEGVGAVASGKVDVLCAPVTPTVASRKQVSHSIPIFASGVGALVRVDGSPRLKALLSGEAPPRSPAWRGNDQLMRETTIAVIKGSRAEEVVKKAMADMKITPRVEPVGDYESGVTRVLEGKASVFFGDRAIMLAAVKRGSVPSELQLIDRQYTQEPLTFALPRGDDDLRLVVDRALSKVFSAADFPALFAKWFGAKPSAASLAMFRANVLSE